MIDMKMTVIEPEEIEKLKAVTERLYDGTILSYDQRRDLAKKLDCVLLNLVVIDY